MARHYLKTKLAIPPLRHRLLKRFRLIERIERGVEGGCRLTLISAPAGFGKTTLIGTWLAASDRAAAWLSIDEADNDPVRFLEYLIAALQTVKEGMGRDLARVLQAPQTPSPLSLMAALIDEIAAYGQPFVLVLDDYHLIRSDIIHNIVTFLLNHQPPTLHLVISTRESPSLPTPRLRARAQLTEITQQDLRFDFRESTVFFEKTMGLSLDPGAIETLHTRAEGWVAGLQLAALALPEDAGAVNTFVSRFSGSDRFIVDYLVAEVLKQQPEDVRTFLLDTAVLDRLNGPLCNAVTGRADSQIMLEHLDNANLFVLPLDREREWFRYHRLFAESLRGTLGIERHLELHNKAMLWHEDQGLISQAMQHALAYAEVSGNLKDVKRLLPLAADEALRRGEVQTVSGWLAALPDDEVRVHPDIAAYMGWVLALSGKLEQAETYALDVQRDLEGLSSPQMALGLALVLRSYVAILYHQNYDAARELATRALQNLDEARPQWRSIALWTIAEAQERTAHISEAIATLRDAQESRSEEKQFFHAAIDNFLASALNNYGRRREAVDVCLQALDRYTDSSGRVSPLAGIVMSRLGLLYYEANDLDRSRTHLDKGIALGKQVALEGQMAFSLGASAFTLFAQGEPDIALEALRTAHHIAEQTGLSDPGVLLAWEANIHLVQGDLPSARRWAASAQLSIEDTPLYLRIDAQLVYARLLLAQGRMGEARTWLSKLQGFLEDRGLIRWRLTVHILQALTAERVGDRQAVRERLAQAVNIAAPEGYYRAFLDEDRRLSASLAEVKHIAPAFVAQLLRYANAQSSKRIVPVHPLTDVPIESDLVDALSAREFDVLTLLASGYNNREMARKLSITPGTVKRHTQNIYSKLGVHSRTQAVAKAQRLGLI